MINGVAEDVTERQVVAESNKAKCLEKVRKEHHECCIQSRQHAVNHFNE